MDFVFESLKGYKKIKCLSTEGNFSHIWLVSQISTQKLYALKFTPSANKKDAENEYQLLLNCADQPHIIQIYDYFQNEQGSQLVLELMNKNLSDLICESSHYGCEYKLDIKYLFKQLILALVELHNISIVHRDIKASNILLDGISNVLKLADFNSSSSLDSHSTRENCYGTAHIQAPEVIVSGNYGHASDVWSAGCVLAEMFSKKHFYYSTGHKDEHLKDMYEILGADRGMDVCLEERKMHIAKHLPECKDLVAIDLLSRIFTIDPKKRITAVDCLSHPFLTTP